MLIRLFGVLVLAFNVWMLVDAHRRRAETYWLFIIMGVPGGSLAYFVWVKLRDPQTRALTRKLWSSLERPPSLAVLRRRSEATPSFANRLALAQGLADLQQFEESKEHFLALLADRQDDPDALYGLGVCKLETGDSQGAADTLSRVVELHPTYREYAAWPELAEAWTRLGRPDDSLELLRKLVQRAPRLPHQLLLAQHLRRAGFGSEARALLERGLIEYDESPRHVRRDHRSAARQARRMLEELASKAA